VGTVDEGSFAQSGVREGDILLEINYVRLESVDAVQSLLQKLPKGQKIPMRILRGNRAIFLPILIQ
jgi:serine protease Do